jgi:hypothetical protein
MIKYNNHRILIFSPEQYKILFADADEKLALLERGYIAAWEALRAERGDHGTERRKATAAAAVQQVANDPLYASRIPGHDSYILHQVRTMLDGDG